MALTLSELRSEYRDTIADIASSHGVENIRIFGSLARGDTHHNSDIDILFTRKPGTDLMDLGGFYMEVRELLGTNIDIVSDTSISPHMRDHILSEAVPL